MISIIATFRDEEENLGLLYRELLGALGRVPIVYEIIFVDDYSDDGSWGIVEKIKQENNQIILIRNKYRRGKGQALLTGIEAARGDQIVFLDSDTQNDPADVRKFLEVLADGYEFANGWREVKHAPFLIRLYSGFFNWFLRAFHRSPFHDINSGFKGFRRRILERVEFDPELFRFFPLAVFEAGFKVAEIRIADRPRVYGKSKFGVFKIFRGFRDFFRFIRKRRQQKTSPM